MKKRGEKSLTMIFGLFMLLIISLVVLAMFFKFFKKGGGAIEEEFNKYAKEAAKDDAKLQCQALCQQITDDNSLIKFCQQQFVIDWNEDGLIDGTATEGKWWFCEKRIPCFALVENCKNKYDGNMCRDKLAELRPDIYNLYYLNGADKSEPVDKFDYTDGCGLPWTGTDPASGQFPTKYNWKERYCYNNTFDEVNAGITCNPPK